MGLDEIKESLTSLFMFPTSFLTPYPPLLHIFGDMTSHLPKNCLIRMKMLCGSIQRWRKSVDLSQSGSLYTWSAQQELLSKQPPFSLRERNVIQLTMLFIMDSHAHNSNTTSIPAVAASAPKDFKIPFSQYLSPNSIGWTSAPIILLLILCCTLFKLHI